MKSDLLLERAHELAAIEGLLNAASQLAAVVLEAGEAGIGKSSCWRCCWTSLANIARVCRAHR